MMYLKQIHRGRKVFTMGQGRKKWEFIFNGHRVSVEDDEKVLSMGVGDGCTM